MKIAVIDVETTGDEPDDVLVEAAIAVLDTKKGLIRQWHSLIHPGDKAISPAASACHHLTRQSFDKNNCLVGPDRKFWRALVKDCCYAVAHQAVFDSRYLPAIKQPWICTYRCSLHIYPDAPKHSLQCLRYYLGLNPTLPVGLNPHRALYDTLCCVALLQEMLKQHKPEELLTITQSPLLLRNCRFGKHKGEKWANIPKDYLKWVLTKDFDEDVKYTARHHLLPESNSEGMNGEAHSASAMTKS